MSAFSRTLVISSKLNNPVTLVFSFDDQLSKGMYLDYFPIVFRAIKFSADAQTSTITYRNQLAFTSPQILQGKIVQASAYEPISVGQETTLELTKSGVPDFTSPVAGAPCLIKAINQTGGYKEIGVGFLDSFGSPTTVLIWPRVKDTHDVTIDFTPKLSAYVIADYEENQILRIPIPSPAIWRENLTNLLGYSNWMFMQDTCTGEYKLVPA